jgi:ribosomal protein S1
VVGIARLTRPVTRLFGKVPKLTDYGAFVEIEQASQAWSTTPK